MLIKEYRIPLPLSVDEYRIAQLYMIQKKSRTESKGAGSGVEIIENKPYEDGPGGSAWFRAVLPAAALVVEEEAWNAYPYTRTRYTTPFVEKFSLDIETRYYNDAGHQENVFDLGSSEMKARIVDHINIVTDPVSSMEYSKDEDPKLFKSEKTHRGPLTDTWIQDCLDNNHPLMSAYKICRVEFRYWGLQSKIERFIHDIALRKTMLRAHRQAWAWQDEWFGLSLQDIRNLEAEAQKELNQTMANAMENGTGPSPDLPSIVEPVEEPSEATQLDNKGEMNHLSDSRSADRLSLSETDSRRLKMSSWANSVAARRSLTSPGSRESSGFRDHLEAIRRDSEDEQYYDAHESLDDSAPLGTAGEYIDHKVVRWNSEEMLDDLESRDVTPRLPGGSEEDERQGVGDRECTIKVLFLVFHGGNVLDTGTQDGNYSSSKQTDINTFKATLENVMLHHYSSLFEAVAVRLVPCPTLCSEALTALVNICPYGNTSALSFRDRGPACCNNLAMSLLPVLSTSTGLYTEMLNTTILRANQVYEDFLHTDEGANFKGQVCLIGDMNGGLFAFDAVYRLSTDELSRNPSMVSGRSVESSDTNPKESPMKSIEENVDDETRENCNGDTPCSIQLQVNDQVSLQRSNTSRESTTSSINLEFKVEHLFLFDVPLGAVIVFRQLSKAHDSAKEASLHSLTTQVHNIFYSLDPCCSRLEPLLCPAFSSIPPVEIAKYRRFPLGDGQPTHLAECVQRYIAQLRSPVWSKAHCETQTDYSSPSTPISARRRLSSNSDFLHPDDHSFTGIFGAISQRWWGERRLDYALYSPEGLSQLPLIALPSILHSSFWESEDVCAFVCRTFVRSQDTREGTPYSVAHSTFSPFGPTEKWLKRKTAFKIKSAAANHRGNDVLVTEDSVQVLRGRFLYGPLDVVALAGEKVDVFVMTKPERYGEWIMLGTELTDAHGRIVFQIPEERKLPHGLYPVKMIVRGDHTFLDMFLAVVPPQTECVVFSIDGSFTASVSVTGKDPKVRAGAVDVVRHWQDLGYLILYITARPDMQQQRVVSWLAQHNFPLGMLFFTEGLSRDPLKQKTEFLKQLSKSVKVHFHVGYGSRKDISVYSACGLTPEQIFAVGRVAKKNSGQANVLTNGYAAHLLEISAGSCSLSRPAQGNGRMILRKGYFNLFGCPSASGKLPQQHSDSGGTNNSLTPVTASVVQRSHSFTPRLGKGKTSDSLPSDIFPAGLDGAETSNAAAPTTKQSPFRLKNRLSKK